MLKPIGGEHKSVSNVAKFYRTTGVDGTIEDDGFGNQNSQVMLTKG